MLDAYDQSVDRIRNQDTTRVRIQVKHVLSGATRTFLQWPQVIEFIEAQLADSGPNQARMEG